MTTQTNFDQEGSNDPLDPNASENRHLRYLMQSFFPAIDELPRIPQQARSREKREELIKAAAKLFIDHGYALTTADDIAITAGVSVGTFYSYFRNKRQILLVLVLERIDSILGNLYLTEMNFSSDNEREAIYVSIKEAMSTNAQTGLRRVWLELVSREPELIPYQQIVRRYTLEQLEEHIQVAVDAGRTWQNLDVAATALVIFTMLDALTLTLHTDNTVDDSRMINAITDFIYRALFPPPPTSNE